MNAQYAATLLKTLADGADPATGTLLAEVDPCRHPETQNALMLAIETLEKAHAAEQRKRSQPAKTGKPWSQREEQALLLSFDSGATIARIAQNHERTRWAITARLEKLGRIEERPWNATELETVERDFALGIPISRIAGTLGRTTGAIVRRLEALGRIIPKVAPQQSAPPDNTQAARQASGPRAGANA